MQLRCTGALNVLMGERHAHPFEDDAPRPRRAHFASCMARIAPSGTIRPGIAAGCEA